MRSHRHIPGRRSLSDLLQHDYVNLERCSSMFTRKTGSLPHNSSLDSDAAEFFLICSSVYLSVCVFVCVRVQECLDLHGQFVGTACGHHGPYTPDVLFWSAILFFSTFFLSTFLKQFKTSRYFPTRVKPALVCTFT